MNVSVSADWILVAGRAQLAHRVSAGEFVRIPAVWIVAGEALAVSDGLVNDRVVVRVDLVAEGAGLGLVPLQLECVSDGISELVASVAGVDIDRTVQDFEVLHVCMASGSDASLARNHGGRSRGGRGGVSRNTHQRHEDERC